MTKDRRPFLLQTAVWICCFGGGLVLVTMIAFMVTAIYERIVPPTDMHLLGLWTTVMMFYVAPVGGIMIVLGGLMWIGVALAQRSKSTKNIS